MTAPNPARPLAPALVGAFFVFATAMALLAGVTLLTPGSPLDAVWNIKPRAHAQLLAMGPWVGWGFLLLACVSGLASYGSFCRRRWGWGLALALLGINGASDAIGAAGGAWVQGLVGVVLATAIAAWLIQPKIRAQFER